MPTTADSTRSGVVREFFGGVAFLGRGLRMWVTSPRLMLIGAIPALIVGVVFVIGIVLLVANIGSLTAWMTPFADGWVEPWQTGSRFVAGAAVVVFALVLLAYAFTAVTLVVGDPFYERIWRTVEERLGNPPGDNNPGLMRSALRGVGDAVRLLVPALLVGLALVACSFIPLVGAFLAFVLGAAFGGWTLTLELAGYSFDARGFTLRDRRRMLGRRRARSLGFGVATYLLFLIPFGAVLVMPAAVAGAAMLSRDALTAAAEADAA